VAIKEFKVFDLSGQPAVAGISRGGAGRLAATGSTALSSRCRLASNWGCRAPGVNEVADGQHGMPQDHARPGVTHHLFDPVPHPGLVTVDGAFGAHRFPAAEPASCQPDSRVIQQRGTLPAQQTATAMHSTAITGEHDLDRPQFPQSPPVSHRFCLKSGSGCGRM